MKECKSILPQKFKELYSNEQLTNYVRVHSMAVRNLTKVWKTETGPSQGDRALSRGPKSV